MAAGAVKSTSSLKVAPSSGPSAPTKRTRAKDGILAADRMIVTAPFPGPPPPLKSHSGFEFDVDGSLRAQVAGVLTSALEKKTREQYNTGITKFRSFCDALNIPFGDRFPISGDLLLAFVCSFAGKVRSGTVRQYLCGLASWHRMWNKPWPLYDSVSFALKGLARLAPPPKELRSPILAPDLLRVRSQLNLVNNPHHAAVWACALVSWWACCRLGETTLPSLNLFSTSRHPSRASVSSPRLVGPSLSLVVDVRFPWTKTTKVDGIVKSLVSVGGPLDPVAALLHHLSLSPVPPGAEAQTPLFAYTVGGGGFRFLAKTGFLFEFNAALIRSGRDAFQGHSFRIGGATAHWHAGASISEIMLLGGWRSDVVTRYLRDYGRGLLEVHHRTAAAAASLPAP
ncbi:hypothetical protein CF319_g6005 [Tilletia indica]|nr:hypothetical protein CF319_g6005 [Tilletia indica]